MEAISIRTPYVQRQRDCPSFRVMDPRLLRAARSGDVVTLGALLEEDPLILEKVSLAPIAETPLHIAVLAGKTEFALEMVRRMPCFAWELNQDGFSPMHIASATGNTEIVRALLTLGHDLCQIKGKGGLTPLHYAAIKGRAHIIEDLLSHCPHAVRDVTARGETALHLSVKNNQLEVLRVLVERHGNDAELINATDEEGNSILKIAIATKQLQVVQLLHGKENVSGLKNQSQERSLEIVDVLPGDQSVGKTAENDPNPSKKPADQSTEKESDMLNAILVVASLIATVTYQAGLSPPSTIWNKGEKLSTKCIFNPTKNLNDPCPAYTFFFFMSFNTAGFLSSSLLILLTIFKTKLPLSIQEMQVLLTASLVSMAATTLL